jgi:hypothetical protein
VLIFLLLLTAFSMLLLALLGPACAYGSLGHWLSGRVAQEFLSPNALDLINSVVPEYKGSLGDACNWADQIKSRPSYRWANRLHYLDPINDDPPRKCAYQPAVDCSDGFCATTAISNFTRQLLANPNNPEALKFLIHIIGDLHQPLHVTGRDKGGNLALAKFEKRTASMHRIWDSLMFEKRMREQFANSRENYALFLIDRIKTAWQSELPDWINCPANGLSNILVLQSDNELAKDPTCPQKWARYSNLVNCVNVWPLYKPRKELSTSYYQSNILVAEKLLAQAAYRIANTLNVLASNQ